MTKRNNSHRSATNPEKVNNGIEPDGKDIEFSSELADKEDLEANARAASANRRMKQEGNDNQA